MGILQAYIEVGREGDEGGERREKGGGKRGKKAV